MEKSGINPPFVGPVAEAFVLGVLQGSFTRSATITALKERVLWQWENPELFGQLNSAVNRLAERKVVTFNDGDVKLAT